MSEKHVHSECLGDMTACTTLRLQRAFPSFPSNKCYCVQQDGTELTYMGAADAFVTQMCLELIAVSSQRGRA